MSNEAIAYNILVNNAFCILSTCTLDGIPWTTPVSFKVDPQGNFYWTSSRETRHSMLIKANNKVSLAVIDMQNYANADKIKDYFTSAVYIEGTAREIPYEELPKYIRFRYPKDERTIADFDPIKQSRSVYQLVPAKVHCLVEPEIVNGVRIDKRVELNLELFKQLLLP